MFNFVMQFCTLLFQYTTIMNWTTFTLTQKLTLAIGSAISITLLYGIYKLSGGSKNSQMKPASNKSYLSFSTITHEIEQSAKVPVFTHVGAEYASWEDNAQKFQMN
jgi:hypothetical protein